MKDDAIQKDVSGDKDVTIDENNENNENKDKTNNDNEAGGIAAPNSAAMDRLRSIDELAKNREDSREDDLKSEEGNEADDETLETGDDDDETDKGKNKKEEGDQELEEKAEKPKTRTLNVNGQDKKFTEDKIYDAGVRALQKESTADQRLEEATQLLKEAQKNQLSKDADDKETEAPDAKAIVQAIQYGDDESAEKAVESLLKGKEGLSLADVRAQVADDLSFSDAMKSFKDEFPDIAKDPTLMTLVSQREQDLLSRGDKRPYKEMYLDIGKQISEWRDGLAKPESTDLEDRKERKKQTKQIKTASKTATKSTEDKQETRTDILDNMRKARRQA